MWEIVGKFFVGVIILRVLFSILKGLYGSFLGSLLGCNTNVIQMGKWAVITGATDGIGKACAFELAKKGLNIVLVSRSPFKLQNTSAEITSKYKVEVKIIDVDFTKTDIYERICNELKNLEVGVLVNNVGMSYSFPQYFWELDDGTTDKLISCNITSVTNMCNIVLPGMLERKKGLIINVSSMSSLIPAPLLTVYAATKAFVTSFSEGLGLEVKDQGIVVQCVAPGFVATNMSKIKRPSLMAPSPTAYIRSTLKTTGIEKQTAGYFMHKLQVYGLEFAQLYLPSFILESHLLNIFKALRTKSLRRMEKESKTQ